MARAVTNPLRRQEIVIIAAALTVEYFLIIITFDYFRHVVGTMFSTPDAQSYLSVANWILGGESTDSSLIRPYFYPLLVAGLRFSDSVYGIWLAQFILWLLSGVLLYQSIKRVTGHRLYSVAGLIVFATNLTLILLTLHALTEVTVVFLLTVLIFLIVNKPNIESNSYWLLVIFVSALLTVTKPLYLYLLLAVLVFRIPFFTIALVKEKQNAIPFVYLGLALLPVLIQLASMKVHYGDFTISHIAARTFEKFYFARLYAASNEMSVIEAREVVGAFDGRMFADYILSHPQESVGTYVVLVKENLIAKSNFINRVNPHPHLSTYMRAVNVFYTASHLIMIPCLFFVLGLSLVKHRYQDLEIMLSLMVPMALIVASSGITFWQGDRIVLPLLPLSVVLYTIVLSRLIVRQVPVRPSSTAAWK